MDYYNLQNVIADTKMRDNIATTAKGDAPEGNLPKK
jgi:uncharacterized protein YqfA (UPF0365 family)